MRNGGQSYRWRQLMYYLARICDGLLWVAPLALAVEQLFKPADDCGCLRNSFWPGVVCLIWAAVLLAYQIGFNLKFNNFDAKNLPTPQQAKRLKIARSTYIIATIILLAIYLAMMRELTGLTTLALVSVIFSSLLYADFAVLMANMIGLEIAVIFSGVLALNGDFYTHSLKLVVIVASLVYGAILLLLSLYNSDRSEPEIIEKTPTKPRDDGLVALVNNLNSGIIRVDDQMRVSLYNAATLGILDTNLTLTNKKISEFMSLTDLTGEAVALETLIKKTNRTQIYDELLYHYQTGEEIRLELTISPVKNIYGVAENNEWILILRDVTKAKNLEMERDEFISVVSHELRTPIAITEASLSNLKLMLKKKPDPLLVKNTLKKAHEQVIFLAAMMNDLSSLARADRSEILQFEELDLRQELINLFDKYQPEVAAKKLNFDLDIDPKIDTLKTHTLYFEEILQNLLTNAIKYTIEGGVTLAAYRQAKTIEVAIIDTGIGIAKPDQAKLFDKFYRVEDYKTRETSGTGLGLYVAQKLAHKIGGEIRIKSRVGFGSTFSLVLPVKNKKN